MHGRPAPTAPVLLPPTRVVQRQSTDLLAMADEDVRAAVSFIRRNVSRGVDVSDVLEVVPISRRYLERKFKASIRRSPLQEIRRTRIERAKELLAQTDMDLPAVARQSGFPNGSRLAHVFREATGMTPTEYRRQSARRLHSPG